MRYLSAFVLMMIVLQVSGQEDWTSWDTNYPERSYVNLITSELNYRDSVEKNPKIGQYYVRFSTYRFNGKYLGKTREISDSVTQSMERIYKVSGLGNIPFAIRHECLFEIDGNEVWVAIQPTLEATLKAEKRKRMKSKSTLYCGFFNEHSYDKKLYNNLLICAFK